MMIQVPTHIQERYAAFQDWLQCQEELVVTEEGDPGWDDLMTREERANANLMTPAQQDSEWLSEFLDFMASAVFDYRQVFGALVVGVPVNDICRVQGLDKDVVLRLREIWGFNAQADSIPSSQSVQE